MFGGGASWSCFRKNQAPQKRQQQQQQLATQKRLKIMNPQLTDSQTLVQVTLYKRIHRLAENNTLLQRSYFAACVRASICPASICPICTYSFWSNRPNTAEWANIAELLSFLFINIQIRFTRVCSIVHCCHQQCAIE